MKKGKATMSKQATIARSTKPVFCGKDETKVAEAAFSGTRSRPVCAINEKGELVVCCRTTARKHGWEVQGKLYQRMRGGKAEAPVAEVKAPAPTAAKAEKPAKLAPWDKPQAGAVKRTAKARTAAKQMSVKELLS